VKLATALRLGAVCAAADLLRLVVNLLDRVEHRLRVGRLGHGFCFLIDPVANDGLSRRDSSSSCMTFAIFCSLKMASSKVSCSRSWASWYSRCWVARIKMTM
jgi:hypothetical protein